MQDLQVKTTVREVTLELLRSFGITKIFGNPGSTELPMFRDFPADFDYVLGLQESVVVAMADGYAQATRRPALVNLHSSAGVGHALGNIFTAFKNQTPLVITAGQQARSILPFEPFLFAAQATEFPKPFVKWSIEPARAEDVPAAIARAFYTAMQPPYGPVFVSIPVDDWDRPCSPLQIRQVSQTIRGDKSLLEQISQALAAAQRPVFVVGAEIARDNAWDEIIALAERHDAAIWVSPMSGRNSFPEDHCLFMGFLPAAREQIVELLQAYDLILALGAPVFTYHVEGHGPHTPIGSDLFQLTCDPACAAWAPLGTAVVCNLKSGVVDLLSGPSPLQPRLRPSPRPPIKSLNPDVLSDAFLCQTIAAVRPNNGVIVEEAPSSRPIMQAYLPMLKKDCFYTCASGGLGHGLPAAIGVAMARPEDKIIALIGDGSSMYAIQALWTAAQLNLPISFIIVNNSRYNALEQFGEHFGIEKIEGTKLPDIDFCSLAEGQGITACRIEQCADLHAALTTSFAATGPTLIDVRVA